MTTPKFYAVRQYSSGKVLGSRLMTEDEAVREVSSWREHIGLAAVVPDSPQTRTAVRANDSAALWLLLLAHEPKVWVATSSHRSRDKLARLARDEHLGELTEHGAWSRPGARGIASGAYYQVPARLADQLAGITGVRVLAREPAHMFKRWVTASELSGPERGNWPVPA